MDRPVERNGEMSPEMSNEEIIAFLKSVRPATIDLLDQDIVALDAGAGSAHLKAVPDGRFANPMGYVQGGIIAALLDDAMSIAVAAHSIAKGRTESAGFPTLEMKILYLQPVRLAAVETKGRVLRFGKRAGFMEGEVYQDGTVCARANGTFMALDA